LPGLVCTPATGLAVMRKVTVKKELERDIWEECENRPGELHHWTDEKYGMSVDGEVVITTICHWCGIGRDWLEEWTETNRLHTREEVFKKS
jgi:hypothetical protein